MEYTASKTVKTRKAYKCPWCLEPISKGEQAVAHKYSDLGKMWNDHFHQECFDAWGELIDLLGPDHCFTEIGNDPYWRGTTCLRSEFPDGPVD